MTPINLNKARKAKARAEKKTRAEANVAKFGRTKAEKDLEETRQSQARTMIDQHKRDP